MEWGKQADGTSEKEEQDRHNKHIPDSETQTPNFSLYNSTDLGSELSECGIGRRKPLVKSSKMIPY